MPKPDYEDLRNANALFVEAGHPAPDKATAAFNIDAQEEPDDDRVGLTHIPKRWAKRNGFEPEDLQTLDGAVNAKSLFDREMYFHPWVDGDIEKMFKASRFGEGIVRAKGRKATKANKYYERIERADVDKLVRSPIQRDGIQSQSSGDLGEDSFIMDEEAGSVRGAHTEPFVAARNEASRLVRREAEAQGLTPEEQDLLSQNLTAPLAATVILRNSEIDTILLEMFDRV